MPDEPILRGKAREAVRQGKLPDQRPDRTWGGPVSLLRMRPVTQDKMEFEIELTREANGIAGLDKLHVFIRCFAVWELARKSAQG